MIRKIEVWFHDEQETKVWCRWSKLLDLLDGIQICYLKNGFIIEILNLKKDNRYGPQITIKYEISNRK